MAKVAKPGPVDQDGQPLASKYDPSDFIVAPSDSKGVSYRLTFRVPPDLEKGIDAILASQRFPFTTRGDVLRWATLRAVKELEQMEGLASISKRVDILTSVLNNEASHSEFMAVFGHLEESVAKYMADQAPDQAVRIIAMAKYQFEGMPEGYWRERYLQELTKRFGHLVGKAAVVLIKEQL